MIYSNILFCVIQRVFHSNLTKQASLDTFSKPYSEPV